MTIAKTCPECGGFSFIDDEGGKCPTYGGRGTIPAGQDDDISHADEVKVEDKNG